MVNIAVIGSGYVGLVAGACFADLGNNVTCVDVDERKIQMLWDGKSPIYEPGLDEILERNIKEKRITFTTDFETAIKENNIIYIAVGTPQGGDGKADLKYVLQVGEDIGKVLKNNPSEKIIVDKSTVPVGTGDKVKEMVAKNYDGVVHIVSNPEFLREGSAIDDFTKPDRVVIGAENEKAAQTIKELYEPLTKNILITNIRTAEMIKYASNTFLATKISFINELAKLCENTGADIEKVAEGMGLDSRISSKFLNTGTGYGGSCFPKDVQALIYTAKENGVTLKIAEAVEEVNYEQKKIMLPKGKKFLGNYEGKTITLWGLSFKPDTDDMREAPSLVIIKELKKLGAKIKVFDPIAIEECKRLYPDLGVEYAEDMYSALEGSDALFIVTEWNEFKEPDFEKIKSTLKQPIVIDGRNIYDKSKMESLGFKYDSIGR